LSGGDGVDTFVFDRKDGTDRIVDFTVGVDKIEILAAGSLADLSFTVVGTGVRIGFSGTRITVDDIALADLQDAANFVF